LTHVQPCPCAKQSGAFGVIDMGFLRIIRKWALRDEMPIREIARRTGVSRIEAVGRHRFETDG